MKVLKNNIREILIWIVYLIGVIFIPLEGTSIYIYVIGLIAIRTLSNTHKLFAKVNSYSEKLKKNQYYLRMICFISFAILGICVKEEKTDDLLSEIAATVFVLTGISIIICELLYFIQKKIENKESKKIEEEKIKMEEKYGKFIFDGYVYTVTNLEDRAMIRKLAYIISNYRIGSHESYFDNTQEMLEKLKKENYIIEQTTNMYRGNASLLCYSINTLLDEFQVDLKITPEMIYQFDDEKIENRRKESLDTIINDTNIINKYLKEFKYKIVVFENYQTYYFALLNEEQISKLNELKNG